MGLTNKINGIKEIWQFDNRWQLVFTRLFFPGEKINIYRYKGLEILEDHFAGDANGARALLTSPMYRQYLAEMELRAPLNVIDMGANNGGFPVLLKSEGLEIKKLVCVEMNPNTFSRLRFNIERNFECEQKLINGAVCGEHRTIDVALSEGSTRHNIYERNSNGQALQVQGYTFDEIFASAFGEEIVDLCKIDIEGAEFEVFSGPEHRSIIKCRYLLMEIHEKWGGSRENVRNRLNELGFREIDGESKNDENFYVHFFVNKKLN
jgi:FkbM family methyltransferase